MADPFFRIHMLPARHGDALLVEYGTTRTRRIIIDGGPLAAYPKVVDGIADLLPEGDQRVELLVVTHVDTDHVEGVIRLLAMPEGKWPFALQEIWFNGWRHLDEAGTLGGREGEFMSALIARRAGDRWNTSFRRKAVRTGAVPGDRVPLKDEMNLTLLSPSAESLAALREDWRASASRDIDPGDLDRAWEVLVEETKFHPGAELTLGPEDLTAKLRSLLKGRDGSTANGSSLAFLAEFRGKSCILLGDAHMDVVCDALEARGHSKDRPLRVDAVKMSHHGSKNNLTPRFLELVDAEHWLVSTNGDIHEHPDRPAIDAVIACARRKPTLWFNYHNEHTAPWEAASRRPGAAYATRYPAAGQEGITVPL